jgi:hypothetical protein
MVPIWFITCSLPELLVSPCLRNFQNPGESVMLKNVLLASVFVLALALVALPASADNVPIVNASFESYLTPVINCGSGCFYNFGPIPGWDITGVVVSAGFGAGSFQPNSTYLNLPVPDGSLVAFSNGATISQTLTVGEMPNSLYTLSVWVGDRKDLPSTPYTIAVDLGAATLCSTGGVTGDIASGGFADVTCSFFTTSVVNPGDLKIVLSSGGTQTVFDDVTLTAIGTPEPGSLALLSFGAIFAMLLAAYTKRGVFTAPRLS